MRSVVGLLAIGLVGLSSYPAWGAATIARNRRDTFYYATSPTLGEASSAVLDYCASSSGLNCQVVTTNNGRGWSAVAKSPQGYGTAMGYESAATAKRVALDGCLAETPVGGTCAIVLTFFDPS